MVEIREYRQSDYEALRDICHKTATNPKYVNNKDLVSACFVEPYMEHCPQAVFVAANEQDEPIGYCISAPDSEEFHRWFVKNSLKKIRKLSFSQAFGLRFEPLVTKSLIEKYPAHLHIDILDGYQRQGVGRRLMDAQLSYLSRLGVKGVHLGVGADNEKGVPFYKKYGFIEAKRLPGLIYFAMSLEDK